MSITPTTPNFSMNDRKFWFKKDSLAGWGVLAGISAIVFYFWGIVSDFVVNALQNGLRAIELVIITSAILYAVFNPRTWMVFRLISRKLTSFFIPIFDEEILDDHMIQVKKRRENMDLQLGKVSGSLEHLKSVMADNDKKAAAEFTKASYARSHTSSEDQLQALKMQSRVKVSSNKAQRLQNANISYKDLLTKLTTIYTFLSKMIIHIDTFIEDTQDQVDQLKIQKHTVSAAYSAYRAALSLINGNATEDDLYNRDVQSMVQDANTKLGMMKDFERVTANFMDNMDVENGVVDEQAMKALDNYEQKMLTAGTVDTAFLLPGNTRTPETVPLARGAASVTGYEDLFK